MLSTMPPTQLQALATAVRRRRAELGYTQGDLAAHGGPGVVTVGKIERGAIEAPQVSTLRALDRALRWQTGSAASILNGDEPTLETRQESPHFDVIYAIRNDPDLLPEAKDHLERQYGLLLRVAAVDSPAVVRAAVTEEMTDKVRGRLAPDEPTPTGRGPKVTPRSGPAKRR